MNRPLKRILYRQPKLDQDGPGQYKGEPVAVPFVHSFKANLVSSKLTDGRHAPALDFDVPARLIPSRTEGHSHLYIDVPMRWWKYKLLLRVLSFVGIIEPGYKRASIKHGFSALRLHNRRRSETVNHIVRALRRLEIDESPPIHSSHGLDRDPFTPDHSDWF